MSVAALGDRTRLAGLALAFGARAVGRRVAGAAVAPLRLKRRTPDKLLIAPQDLRTSDPTRAGEIYAGVFALGGRTVSVEGRSPFLVAAPSLDWAEALHGFGWLRHLRAADTTLARQNGRALVDEWISLRGGTDAAARRADVVARRLISWFCHAPLILDGADRAFYRRFLRSLNRQTGHLARSIGGAPDGAPRLTATVALAYAGLCLAGQGRLLRAASKALAEELDRQVLPDGGHLSRNPATLVDALLDALPLRQAFAARNAAPPQQLVNAIDRMMPMLRFFRHADGEFAQFNGAGPTQADRIATILAYDDARGEPPENAPHSGYQRLSEGQAVVIVDAGGPPPPPVSGEAHAGCLSFELSAGAERIVVNCGAPGVGRSGWTAAARSTAAHSTATIGDLSSCRFASGRVTRLIGEPILAGPKVAPARREAGEDGVRVVASHDGYADRFGVIHERSLSLSADGRRLDGEDVFRPAAAGRRNGEAPRVAIRFHLHPSVRASARQDGHGVLLALPSGSGWTFTAPDVVVDLEESVYLAGAHGPKRTEQIVIHATIAGASRIAWGFESLDQEPSGRSRRLPPAATLFGAPPTTA